VRRPDWLIRLFAPDIVGITVAIRVPHPTRPGKTAIEQRSWLDPDIALRVAFGMKAMLQSSINAVAEMYGQTVEEDDEPVEEIVH
jgi:hypothetical protein